MLVSEVNILRDLQHPNIVRYYDRVIDKENTKIYIVMEYCPGGDLASVIKKQRRDRWYWQTWDYDCNYCIELSNNIGYLETLYDNVVFVDLPC